MKDDIIHVEYLDSHASCPHDLMSHVNDTPYTLLGI